ncbi:Nucleobase-ascorbate transporter 5 [Capsicum chinense]|nr:Nucleobase-ascorbate transporter 5 [Capsicum chinense]
MGPLLFLSDYLLITVEAILLGFQHYLIMLSTIVIIPTALVPQMGGGNEEKAQVIQTSLFVAGLNTLLRSFFGTRLPAVIGGSYTYVAPTISIILSGQWNDEDPVRLLSSNTESFSLVFYG